MKYINKKLDNDMNIILIPTKNTQLISIGFFISAGSRNETDDNNGVAHFLEHMLFKGTTNRTPEQLFNELDTLGAVYNAATTTQHTYYYIYGNSDDTKHLLDIIFDIYINTKFDSNEINKEKKIIIEEMRMRLDSPMVKLYSKMHKKIFAQSSLSRNIIGNLNTITNLNKKDLIEFKSDYYKPKNTIFIMVGNFNPQPIFKIIKKVLNSLKNSSDPIIPYVNEKSIILKNMTSQKEPYIYTKKNNDLQQVYVLFAFPMYDLYNCKNKEIDLITQLLSTGFSSRLNKALRENNGITYTSTAYPIVYSDAGVYLIQMILNPTELINGVKIVLSELDKIKKNLITKNELKKIINITKNEILYSLIKPLDLLTYYGVNFLTNRNYKPNIREEFRDIKLTKRSQIQNVAIEIFNKNKLNLFIYGNVQTNNLDLITHI